jgi:hypothetical protein
VSDHTLSFKVLNVSADGEPDDFTVELPDDVSVESITETTITDQETGESVPLAGDDPAEETDPGNTIQFTVDEQSKTGPRTLAVDVEMELSATP